MTKKITSGVFMGGAPFYSNVPSLTTQKFLRKLMNDLGKPTTPSQQKKWNIAYEEGRQAGRKEIKDQIKNILDIYDNKIKELDNSKNIE